MNTLRAFSARMRTVKVFIILALAALAVYQAGLLWFEDIADGVFFPRGFFSSWGTPEITEDISDLARPFRIVSGTGGGTFSINYSNSGAAAEYGSKAISAVLSGGAFVAHGTEGYAELLTRPAYVYEYTFNVPPAAFAAAVGQRAALFTSNNVPAFKSIVVYPPVAGEAGVAGDSGIHVYFLTETESYHFSLTTPAADGQTYEHVIVPAGDGAVKYKLEQGSFAAEWADASYQPISVTNPYLHAYGDKLISTIKACVETFFENPAAITESSGGAEEGEAGGTLMTFSDADTVVRYYQNDVLEYSNFRVTDRNVTPSFALDYAAALAFVNADTFIVNEFYLAGYTEDGERRTFMFDYVINNFPLLFTEGRIDETTSRHAIEVTVTRGVTVNYKKLVYNYHIISMDDLTIKDSFAYPGGSGAVPVLGYPIPADPNETLALDYINRY